MALRDYLKSQIDQLGKVMARLAEMAAGIKTSNQPAIELGVMNEELLRESEIDVNKLLSLEKEDLKTYVSERTLDVQNVELLATYLEQCAIGIRDTDEVQSRQYLEKSIRLLELADEISGTYSFPRGRRTDELKAILQTWG